MAFGSLKRSTEVLDVSSEDETAPRPAPPTKRLRPTLPGFQFPAQAPPSLRERLGEFFFDEEKAHFAALTPSADSWMLLLRGFLPPGPERFESLWQKHPRELGKAKLFGKEVTFHRYQQAFGADYAFSGQVAAGAPLSEEAAPEVWFALSELRHHLSAASPPLRDHTYGACLVNWYDGGQHSIGAHSDDEKGLVEDAPIFALSWGGPRLFRVTPKTSDSGAKVEVDVKDGDLIVMGGTCQRTHKHAIPPSAKCRNRRISLTFRCFRSQQPAKGIQNLASRAELWTESKKFPAHATWGGEMFVPASRQFSLSAETKAQIKAHTEGYRGSARASLLHAARKAREQFQNQWLDFCPGSPLLAKKRHFDVQTDGWVEEQVLIQLDTAAFGKGAVRECFRMKEVRLDTRLLAGSPQRSKKGEDGNTSSTQFVGASIPSCDEGDPKEAAVRDMGCAAGVPDHPPAPPSKAMQKKLQRSQQGHRMKRMEPKPAPKPKKREVLVESSWDSASWNHDIPNDVPRPPNRLLHDRHIRKMDQFRVQVEFAPTVFSEHVEARRQSSDDP
eukprot:s1109_g4.t1